MNHDLSTESYFARLIPKPIIKSPYRKGNRKSQWTRLRAWIVDHKGPTYEPNWWALAQLGREMGLLHKRSTVENNVKTLMHAWAWGSISEPSQFSLNAGEWAGVAVPSTL